MCVKVTDNIEPVMTKKKEIIKTEIRWCLYRKGGEMLLCTDAFVIGSDRPSGYCSYQAQAYGCHQHQSRGPSDDQGRVIGILRTSP